MMIEKVFDHKNEESHSFCTNRWLRRMSAYGGRELDMKNSRYFPARHAADTRLALFTQSRLPFHGIYLHCFYSHM